MNPLLFWRPNLAVGLIRLSLRTYQLTLSPLLTLLSGQPHAGCRFQPTCSRYFLEAVETHGARRGSWLGLKRLGRCHPWGGKGYDPVPPTPGSSPAGACACPPEQPL